MLLRAASPCCWMGGCLELATTIPMFSCKISSVFSQICKYFHERSRISWIKSKLCVFGKGNRYWIWFLNGNTHVFHLSVRHRWEALLGSFKINRLNVLFFPDHRWHPCGLSRVSQWWRGHWPLWAELRWVRLVDFFSYFLCLL